MAAQVLKFGGSTFADLSDFTRVASSLAKRLWRDRQRLAVVVSAMPGSTERLRAQAAELTGRPSPATIDRLLPLADIMSATLMTTALEAAGVTASLLVGYTLGLVINAASPHARLTRTDPGPLRAALDAHQVVLVAGGQAVDEFGRQRWMGKNSSDLSAVAVAAALGAGRIEIFSDVDGVYSGDPNSLSGTCLLPALSWESARLLGECGAEVLHPEAVRLAGERGIEIVCRSNRSPYGTGTVIGGGDHGRAVVLDLRAAVATFEDADATKRVQAALRAAGVASLRLLEPERAIAVPGGYFDLGGFLASYQLGGVTDDRCLLSVVDRGEAVSRLVARSTAVTEAQAIHDRLLAGGRTLTEVPP